MADWQPTLTELGKRLQAEALAQQSPAMMGIPQAMLTQQAPAPAVAPRTYSSFNDMAGTTPLQAAAYSGGAAPANWGGAFKFDPSVLPRLVGGTNAQATSAENGTTGYEGIDGNADRWQRFIGADGQQLVSWPTGDGRYLVFPDPGDFGGGWLGQQHEADKMNGRPFEIVNADGTFGGSSTFKNWSNDFVGPWGALAVIAMAAGAAGAGLGAASGATGAATGATTAGTTAAGTAAGGSGAFLGEGVASGIGAWDAALANAPAWTAGGGLVANGANSNLFPGESPWTPTPGSTPLTFTPEVPTDLFPEEAPWSPTPNAQPLDFTPPTGVPPPANPFTTPPGAESLIPGISDQLLGTLGTAAIGAIGGGGSTPGGTTSSLNNAEEERQRKVQAAVDAINKQFGYGTGAEANKTAREGMYTDISGAVRDTAMRDLDRQYGKASKANTFGLARSGLLGGSVDAESGGELQDLYGEGRLKAAQAGLGAASDLRLNDEKSRQNLISLAQTGLDTGTASSLAAGSMGAAADLAKSQSSGATVGRLFDDLSQAYVTNQSLKARYPNGLPQQSTSYGSGSLFGTSRYTGTKGA